MSIPYFPNLLSLASPYAVSLNFFDMMEYQMRHMDRLFGEVRRRNATTFEVTEEANARFRDRMSKLQHNTVFYLRRLRQLAVVLLRPPRRDVSAGHLYPHHRFGADPLPVE